MEIFEFILKALDVIDGLKEDQVQINTFGVNAKLLIV